MSEQLKGKPVGSAERPRVALIGLDPAENSALDDFFPTIYRMDELNELEQHASPRELDLIVSSNTADLRFSQLSSYATCHLILFGEDAWGDSVGPTSDGSGFYHCRSESSSRLYHLATDIPPTIESELTAIYGGSALGAPIITFNASPSPVANKVDLLQPSGWLAWAEDPRRALALCAVRESSRAGLAWFPKRPVNCVQLTKAICSLWAKQDREAFPSLLDWTHEHAWQTVEERRLIQDRLQLEAAHAALVAQYQAKHNALIASIEGARRLADAGPRALLTEQDALLVKAVAAVLSDLGFVVEETDAKRDPKLPKREDLLVRDPEMPGWVALVEVKGHRRRGANDEDLTKIEKHAANFLRDEGRDPSLKMYVCNSQFALDPSSRPVPYAGNPGSVTEFCDDQVVPGVIVPTPDLFKLHRDRHTVGLADARRRLISHRGVFRYPST